MTQKRASTDVLKKLTNKYRVMDYLRDLLQENRVKYAINVLSKLGFMIERVNNSTLKFEYKGSVVLLYPYTGEDKIQ